MLFSANPFVPNMTTSSDDSTQLSGPTTEVLSLTVRSQILALPVLAIQEVRRYERPAPLPKSGPAYQGVLNLRGKFVPVVDLGLLLGMDFLQPTSQSIIVVMDFKGRVIGFAVDAVNDVVAYSDQEVHSVTGGSGEPLSSYIKGILTVNDKPVQLVDLSAVLGLLGCKSAIPANAEPFALAA